MEDHRIKVDVYNGETIVNQCARAAMNSGRDVSWFTDFLKKAESCMELDTLMRFILTQFDVRIRD